jgi:hypothetical protein
MEPPAPPPPASLWFALIGIAVLSCLMVLAMVRYSRALLAAAPAPRERVVWGTTYALAWAGIIAGFLWMFHAGRAMTRHNLTMLVIVAGFWWALHAVMIALARAIRIANENSPPPSDTEPDESFDTSRDEADEPALEPAQEPAPAAAAAVGGGNTLGQRLGNAARMVVMLVVVLLVIGIGEAIPAMQRLKTLTDAHRVPLLTIGIAAAVLGTLLLAGGGAAMAVRGGRRMTRDEIDQAGADVRMWHGSGHVARKAVYRNLGDAEGVTASDAVTLTEFKHAWRTRAWRVSPRWRIIFVMGFGATVMAAGIWGTLLVLAPAGVKFLVTLVFGYALVRIVWAMYRC